MIKITSPISILEFASSHIRLAIYEDNMFSNQIFFEEKIDFTRQEKYFEDQIIDWCSVKIYRTHVYFAPLKLISFQLRRQSKTFQNTYTTQ